MDVLRVAVGMLLSILLPLLVQLWDRRQLRERGGDGPWNTASWGAALYAFGPLSMLAWGHLTRPRPWRWLMGPGWCAGLLLVVVIVSGDTSSTDMAATLLDWLLAFGIFFGGGAVVVMLIDAAQSLWRSW